MLLALLQGYLDLPYPLPIRILEFLCLRIPLVPVADYGDLLRIGSLKLETDNNRLPCGAPRRTQHQQETQSNQEKGRGGNSDPGQPCLTPNRCPAGWRPIWQPTRDSAGGAVWMDSGKKLKSTFLQFFIAGSHRAGNGIKIQPIPQ